MMADANDTRRTSRRAGRHWVPFALLLAVAALYAYTSRRAPEGVIPWERDLAGALRQAGQEQRGVLLYFSSPHCPPCRAMGREVFTRPEVVQVVGDLIPVRLTGEAQPELRRKFAVYGYPTFLVLRPDGTVAHERLGEMTYDGFRDFVTRGRRALAESSTDD